MKFSHVDMDAMSGIPALVFCYTLMIFYFWLLQYRHFSCLLACEKELERIDRNINVKKSSCMHIGPRFNVHCTCITTRNGGELSWSDTLRYLGVYITAGHKFCCSPRNHFIVHLTVFLAKSVASRMIML